MPRPVVQGWQFVGSPGQLPEHSEGLVDLVQLLIAMGFRYHADL